MYGRLHQCLDVNMDVNMNVNMDVWMSTWMWKPGRLFMQGISVLNKKRV